MLLTLLIIIFLEWGRGDKKIRNIILKVEYIQVFLTFIEQDLQHFLSATFYSKHFTNIMSFSSSHNLWDSSIVFIISTS